MSHAHTHSQSQSENIRVAFLLNLGFTLFEIVGGLYTNSLNYLPTNVANLISNNKV